MKVGVLSLVIPSWLDRPVSLAASRSAFHRDRASFTRIWEVV